jgi:putative transposase
MPIPKRPKRLDGFPYDAPGPIFHCRLGCLDRKPFLAVPETADVVVEALRFRHRRSADILAFAVMPDHVHLLLSLLAKGTTLSRWIGDLKRWTVRTTGATGGTGLVWQTNFYEHVLRRDEELAAIAQYILENPVRKGLATRWQSYRWCGSFAWRLDD